MIDVQNDQFWLMLARLEMSLFREWMMAVKAWEKAAVERICEVTKFSIHTIDLLYLWVLMEELFFGLVHQKLQSQNRTRP